MKFYRFDESPLKLYGVPLYDREKLWQRLPDETLKDVSNLTGLARRCPGARVCLRTDSPEIAVKYTFETFSVDIGMSIYACQSAHVLVGDRRKPYFAGLIGPKSYDEKTVDGSVKKKAEMEDVTIFLPRNERICDIEIGVADGARVEAPTPYDGKPIVYYGSSITEGGCCCNPFNVYNAAISNHLNMDYVNLGFSGSAKGELVIADFINTLDMSAFVYDYDNNSPTADTLRATHEPFFRRIREKHPDLPILMMSMPREIYDPEFLERRDIIRETYDRAVAAGDKHVAFIDGFTFFGDTDRHTCMVDGTHPNDLGFYRMTQAVEPVLRKLLNL